MFHFFKRAHTNVSPSDVCNSAIVVLHQSKTPIAALKYASKSLLDGEQGALSPEQRHMVEQMAQQTMQLETYLGMLAVQDGVVLPALVAAEPVPTNLHAFLDAVLRTFSLQLQGQRHTLRKEYANESLSALLDVRLCAIAVGNVLDNAIKYTPQQGTITVQTRMAGEYAELIVSDTGPGVGNTNAEAVPAGTHDGAGQSGLGLDIARQIFDLHHAHMVIQSGTSGTTVVIKLPVAA